MGGVCGDNRFEIIAKVKEHLIKATNIESQPKELEQLDNILFRLWQLGYFNLETIPKLKEEIEDWKSCHEREIELMKGLNDRIADLEKKVKYYEQQLSAMEKDVCDVCKVKDADYYEKQIADLEKKLKESEHNKKTVVHLSECVSDIQDKQLEQATKIIKNLLGLYFAPLVTNEDLKKQDEIIEQAKQFLNLSEKATN